MVTKKTTETTADRKHIKVSNFKNRKNALKQRSGTFLTGTAIKAKYFKIYFIENHIVFLTYNKLNMSFF